MPNQTTPPAVQAVELATPQPQTPETKETLPGQPQETAPQEKVYVTRDELDQRDAELERRIKLADRQRAKQISERVNALEKTLEGSGVQVTPQVKERLQAQVVSEIETEDEQPASTEADNLADIPPDWKNAIDMMAEAGVTIEKDTPEFDKHIKPLLSNPNPGPKLLLAVSQAITETQARLNLQKDKAQLRVPGGPGSQAPGDGEAKSAKELWSQAYQKK